MDFSRPRPWQEEALDALWPRLRKGEDRRHLIFVATGGGKTFFGAWLARLVVDAGLYRRVVILTPPRTTITDQWKAVMKDLACASVVTFMDAAKVAAADASTMVVVDEFHHLAEKKCWGDKAERFCAAAADCVLLSGTPKRSDGVSIPLLSGFEQPVYEYRYGAAVRDNVCRRLVAHDDYDGRMSWTEGEKLIEHSFGVNDDQEPFAPKRLDARQDSRRFNTAIQAGFSLVQRMLRDAVSKLRELRASAPRAQGMVIVTSEHDADEVADFMRAHCKVDPLVVKSSSGRSDADVAAFKANVGNHKAWIISITKISEGTDVPNLCVLVYKSRIRTDLFMTQVAGRVIRTSGDTTGVQAHVYYPRDERVRKVFVGLQAEADAACASAPLAVPTTAVPAATPNVEESEAEDERDGDGEPEGGWAADVDDGSSDGSVDSDARPWECVSAELEEPNDETPAFQAALSAALGDKPAAADVVAEKRALLREVFSLPPIHAVVIPTTPEHQRRRILEKFNREVYAYARRYKRQLGPRGKSFQPLLAKEKARLVLRLLKRNDRRNDWRRKPSELDVSELEDVLRNSLPSRVTKLSRLAKAT